MQSKYIADFVEGDKVDKVFLIDNKSLLTTKAGKPYINLKLRDKTDSITGMVWDNADTIFKQLGPVDFVQITGSVDQYQNKLQLKIRSVKALKSDNIDMSEFIAASDNDVDEMMRELEKLCKSIENKHLKMLVGLFLEDEDFVKSLKSSPAARNIHHAFIGGLLEHTLSVMQICDKLSEHYKDLNRDLIIAGAFLHDIGKIHELDSGKGFNYTREGHLIGHIVIGYNMVDTAIDKIEKFPEKLRTEIEHIILSHQGKLEFKSPVVPMFPEAKLIHYVDDLDAKMQIFKQAIDSNVNVDSEFTDRIWELDARIYRDAGKEESD